ncbi:MAG: S-layer homology domain-containing protein, partial [Acidaminococcaceae bacterium]|nr:S-layer homology domain-containing protein [Acidaminococcaceae bacterium]
KALEQTIVDTNTTYTINKEAGTGTAGDIVNTYTITDSDGKALEQTIVDTNTVLEESANGLTLSGNSIKLSVKDTSGNEVSGTVSLSDIQTAVDTTYTLSGTSKTEGNNTTYTVDLTDSKGKPAGTMTIVDTNTTYTIGAEAGEGSTINTYTVTDSDGKALEQTIVDTNTTYTMTTTAGTGKVVNKYTITGSDGKNLGEIEDTDTDTQYELFGEKKKNENGATYKISLKDREGNDAGSMIIADTRNTVTAGDNIQVKTEDNEDGSINYIISASASSNVKVIDGENTTVTEGQDGDFTTYAVNVATNGTVASGDTGIVTGDTVYNETRVQNDGNFIKADNSAAENLTVLDEQVSANTTNIENLGNQINNTNNQINRLDSRMRKGLAGAAALAALHPMDFNPDDKMQFAAGVGNYRGETAAAVGAFYRPDESVMFSIGGTFGNNDNMVNAGITFGLDGTRNRITRSRTAMAHEIVELRDHIAKQDQQIAQLTNLVNKLVGPEQRLENPSMFPDVPANHWAYQYIEDLQKRGIIEGYPDGNFSGNRSMTRYEFAAMLDRALQKGVKLDADIAKEFEAELGRIYVERIAGQDNDRKKIERVRVNNDDAKTRDFYGSKILTVAAEKAAGK